MNLGFLLPLGMLMAITQTVTAGVSATEISDTGTDGISTTGGHTICQTVIQTFNHCDSTVYTVNETIRLSCSLTSDDDPNISLFYLLHTGNEVKKRLEPSYAAGDQAVFEIEAAAVDDDGQYDCYYGDCNVQNPNWRSLIQIHVIDRTKPHLECMSTNVYNYTAYNMTCRWFRSSDRYSSCWMIQSASRRKAGDLESFQNCTGKNMQVCEEFYYEQSCTILLNNFLYTMEYEVRLLENLSIGGETITASYNYTVPANASIVKLNPVVGAQVLADAPRQMTLTWKFEGSSISITDKILCRITYWSEWEDLTSKQVYDFIRKPRVLILEYSKQLDNLEPFTKYMFNITIKAVTSPYWSKAVNFEEKTLPEVPVVIPKSVAYTEEMFNDSHRAVVLYWEPIQPRFYYGPNASYILNITCSDQSEWTEAFSPTVYTARINQYLSSSSSCDITVQSENSNGISEEKTTIHIPPFQKNNKQDLKVQVEELDQNTYNVLVKDTSSRSKNVKYSVYWCQGYHKRNTPICLENYHSLVSEDTNFTVVVNQSSDQHALFFGASVLEGNQSSSLLWASDGTGMVSEGPVAKENEDTQKIKIVVGVCVSVVMFGIVWVLACYVYRWWRNRFKHYEINVPDISVSQQNRPPDIPLRVHNNIDGADIETFSNTNSEDTQRSNPSVQQGSSISDCVYPSVQQESSVSDCGSTDSQEALLGNCGSEHQDIESSSYCDVRTRQVCATRSKKLSGNRSRNGSDTWSRNDSDGSVTRSRNDSDGSVTRSRNDSDGSVTRSRNECGTRTVIAEAVSSQSPGNGSSSYVLHNALQGYAGLNTNKNIKADCECELQNEESISNCDIRTRHDRDTNARNDINTTSRNDSDTMSRHVNEPSNHEFISGMKTALTEVVFSQDSSNESSPYVPHNDFYSCEGLNTHKNALGKSEHQDGESILDCDNRSKNDSDAQSIIDKEATHSEQIPERRSVTEAEFSENPDTLSSPYLPHNAFQAYVGLNSNSNATLDKHLLNVTGNAPADDRNLSSGSDYVSDLSCDPGNMSDVSANTGGYVSHSVCDQERFVESYIRTSEDNNMLWMQSIRMPTEGQINDESTGRIQSSTNEFGTASDNDRNMSALSGTVCNNDRNLSTVSDNVSDNDNNDTSSDKISGYVPNDVHNLQQSSVDPYVRTSMDNNMLLVQSIRPSTEGQIKDENAGKIQSSTNILSDFSDNDRNVLHVSVNVFDNDRNLSTISVDVSNNERNPLVGSDNVSGYVSNNTFNLEERTVDSYVRTSMDHNMLWTQSIKTSTEGQITDENAGRIQSSTNVVGHVSNNDGNLTTNDTGSNNVSGYVPNDVFSQQECSVDPYVRTSIDNNMLLMESIRPSIERQINDGNAECKKNSTNVFGNFSDNDRNVVNVSGNVSDNDRNMSVDSVEVPDNDRNSLFGSDNVSGYVSNSALSLEERTVDSYVRMSMDHNMLWTRSIRTSTEGQINNGNAECKQNSTNI